MLRKTKGFTLVEVIVVLVILAILAALLIPSMTQWIKKAQEKQVIVEARNCVLAAQTLATEAYGRDEALPQAGDSEILTLAEAPVGSSITTLEWGGAQGATVQKLVYQSARGVVVTYENGEYTIGESGSGSGTSFAQGETLTTIWDSAAEVFKQTNALDSGALADPQSNSTKLKAELAKQGIDLDAMGAKTWKMQNTAVAKKLYWTPTDISGLPAGTVVPAMCYDFATGTYTVYEMRVGSATLHGVSYNTLSTQGKLLSSSQSASEQTYDRMLEDYQKAAQ